MSATADDLFGEEMQQEMQQAMTPGEVENAIREEIRWSSEVLEYDLSVNRQNAWLYFKGEAPGKLDDDVDEHFDRIVSRDVADTIESALAEILPAFATDRPAAFDPAGQGDEDAAELESDICNDILMEAGSGFLELTTAAKNALLLRLGVLEVIWDDAYDVRYFKLGPAELVSPEVMAKLEMDQSMEVRLVTSEDGEPPQLLAVEYIPRDRCRVEAVPIDEILISSDCQGLDLDSARFVGRQTLVSRSELIAKGYDREVVEELPEHSAISTWESRRSRERNQWGRDKQTGDRATDLIMTVRCYYRLDEDRDGIAELRRIVAAGSESSLRILEDEPVDYQPFAAGAGYIWPHQPYGISLYDKLKQVQDLKSKFWRIMLEAGQRAARDRAGILPGTNEDDWRSSQFGGAVRMTSPNGVVPIPNPQFPQQLGMLQEIADKARREGGGGAVDKSNQEAMPVEAGAHGVERMLAAIEELNSMVARMLAETLVRQCYLKIHHVLRLYSPPIPKRVGGNWVMVDPSSWTPRQRVSVATGLTLSERNRLAQAAGVVVASQKELLAQGSTLVNQRTLYRAMLDQARFMGLQNPRSYFIDPSSEEGQQAAQAAREAQQQQAQQQAEIAQKQVEQQGQMLAMIEQIKNQGRMQAETVKANTAAEKMQADFAGTMAKLQQDTEKWQTQLSADMQQWEEKLAQQYDELRVKVAEIDAKHDIEDEKLNIGSEVNSE